MNNITRDFVSQEQREYKIKIGGILASALSGFIAGIIVASIIWMVAFRYLSPGA
jgi:tetrahydromethanopterin S-methyltransferase subunit B